jgi:hypothetical protein
MQSGKNPESAVLPYPATNAVTRPITLAATVLLSLVVYGLFLGHGVAPAVVGYNLVPSERVLGGEVPYRDFLYNYTPGTLWLNALLFKFLGISLLVARGDVLIAKVVSALMLFLVARRYMSPFLSILTVAMMLAWVGYGDILKVFPTQYGMPLLLASCFAALRAQESATPKGARIWFTLAGALAAGVFLFKHNVGIFVLIAAMASAIAYQSIDESRHRREPSIRARLVALGFAVVAGAAFVYLATCHALSPMLAHFVHHASAYGEAKGIALPHPALLLAFALTAGALVAAGFMLTRAAPAILPAYVVAVFVLLLIVVAVGDRGPVSWLFRSMLANVYYLAIYFAAAGMIWSVILYRRRDVRFARTVMLVSFAVAAFLEIFPRSDPDHLVRVIPPSLLLMCVMLSQVRRKEAERPAQAAGGRDRRMPRPPGALVALILVVGACLLVIALGIRVTWAPQFGPGIQFKANTPLTFDRGLGVSDTPAEAARLNGVVSFVQNNTGADDPIFAASRKTTGIYFLAGRRNVTRLLWPDSAGILLEDREAIRQMIVERRFKLILVGGDQGGADSSGADSEPDEDRRILRAVNENYHPGTTIDGVTVLLPNQ